MRTWKKLYRITWNEAMEDHMLLAAAREAFPEAQDMTWNKHIEDRKLYLRDAEGNKHYVTTVDMFSKYAIKRIMAVLDEHDLPNPFFETVENAGAIEERLNDASEWWPGLDEEVNESAVLDSRSLYLTIIRHLDDDVDPLTDGVFAFTDEQMKGMFHALRKQAQRAVKRNEWDNALFNTGCEMIAVDEEHLVCPSDW